MNRKTKRIACGSTVALALLAVSAPHIGQEPTIQPHVRHVSAFVKADRAIPPPEPLTNLAGKETANPKSNGTPPTEIAFEPQKPNATTEILTTNEPSRGSPTPPSITLRNTETAWATDLEMIFVR